MLVVRVTKNVRAVQSSYYSSCPWSGSLLLQMSAYVHKYRQSLGHDCVISISVLAFGRLRVKLQKARVIGQVTFCADTTRFVR
jgi:hypothetical protein